MDAIDYQFIRQVFLYPAICIVGVMRGFLFWQHYKISRQCSSRFGMWMSFSLSFMGASAVFSLWAARLTHYNWIFSFVFTVGMTAVLATLIISTVCCWREHFHAQ